MRTPALVCFAAALGAALAACRVQIPNGPAASGQAPPAFDATWTTPPADLPRGAPASRPVSQPVSQSVPQPDVRPPAARPPGVAEAVAWTERPQGRLTRCPRSRGTGAGDACPRWTFDAEAGLFSKYVWRGLLVGDDPVVQGSLTASRGGFSFNVWGNVDLTDINATEYELNEVDLTPNYTHRVKNCGVPLDLSVGAVAYLFPVTDTETVLEVYASISADVPLRPSLTVWREVLDFDYTYVTFDVGHAFDCGCFEIELDAGVGWGDARWHDAYLGVAGSGWNDVSLSAAAVFPRGRWTFIPKVWYSSLIRSDLRDAVADPDLWVAALIVAFRF